LTIIALAKTLGLPVISSEKKTNIGQDSDKRQKILIFATRKASSISTSMTCFALRGSRTRTGAKQKALALAPGLE
jgi:hypothetical protein